MDVVEPHEAENRANAGDGAQQISGMSVMVRGGSDDGELEGTEPLLGAADEGEIDVKACVHRGIGTPFRDAVAIGLVGNLVADRRPVVVAVGLLHVRQEVAACACQGRASAQQVAGGAHLARLDIRLREHAAAQEHRDCMGVDRVMFGLAPRDGLHLEGRAEDKREALFSTEVSKPVPGKQPFGSDDELIAVRGDRLETRVGGGWHVTVP